MWLKLVVGILFFVSTENIYAEDYEKWNLQNREIPDTEYLSYKLSYSGIFTLFAWKDLADMAIYIQPKSNRFNGNKSCQIVMELSTENYSVAETFHPIRYQWRSTCSPDLKKAYLVEVIDKGKNDSHEVVWLDWSNRQFELYRKRELKATRKNYWDDNEFWNGEPESDYVWEKDGKKGLPLFLSHYPKLEGERSYLIHRKSVDGLDIESAIDPLGMVYLTRQYDFSQGDDMMIDITVDDEVKLYRARFLGKDTIDIGSEKVVTLKIEVMLSNEQEAENEGWLKLWLSDDERRIPVRFQVDATAGEMKIEITEKSFRNNINHSGVATCVIRGSNAITTPLVGTGKQENE